MIRKIAAYVAAITVMGGALAAQGASVAEAATPECNSTRTYTDEVGPIGGFEITYPSRGGSSTCLMREGANGKQVKALQFALRNVYYKQYNISAANITIDGAFGPATKAALKAAQRRHNLTADGIYGPATRNKLCWATAGFPTSYPQCGVGAYFG